MPDLLASECRGEDEGHCWGSLVPLSWLVVISSLVSCRDWVIRQGLGGHLRTICKRSLIGLLVAEFVDPCTAICQLRASDWEVLRNRLMHRTRVLICRRGLVALSLIHI